MHTQDGTLQFVMRLHFHRCTALYGSCKPSSYCKHFLLVSLWFWSYAILLNRAHPVICTCTHTHLEIFWKHPKWPRILAVWFQQQDFCQGMVRPGLLCYTLVHIVHCYYSNHITVAETVLPHYLYVSSGLVRQHKTVAGTIRWSRARFEEEARKGETFSAWQCPWC